MADDVSTSIVIGDRSRRLCLRHPRRPARPEGGRASRSAPPIGGTCLNVGCIPSKALLHASELFFEAEHSFADDGHRHASRSSICRTMMSSSRRPSKATSRASSSCSRRTRSTAFHGTGRIARPGKVEVRRRRWRNEQALRDAGIVIATGSDSARLPGIDIDEQRIVSSTGALDPRQGPARAAGHRRRRHRP